MKLFFVFVICVVMTSQCSADADSWHLVCNREAPSNPTGPVFPVKRGKMGPRGEKGEKGDNGRKGTDLSREIEENGEKIFEANTRVDYLEEELKKQRDTISEFKYFFTMMNDTIRNKSEKIELLQTMFEKREDEMSTKVLGLERKIEDLEESLNEQTFEIKLLTTFRCKLPHIKHLDHQIPRKTDHNSSIQLTCSSSKHSKGVSNRTCVRGDWIPDFKSNPFVCGGIEVAKLVGMSDGSITDDQITASGYFGNQDAAHPRYGRLNDNSGGYGGWWGKTSYKKAYQWIQVDLRKQVEVVGIAVQGSASRDRNEYYVTKFKIQYGQTENSLKYITDKSGNVVIFEGPSDEETVFRRKFPEEVTGVFFRIEVVDFHRWPALRFDLLSF